MDQFNRVQSFVPETFWYISVGIERQDEDDDPDPQRGAANAATRMVEFKWRRNHLFDEDVVGMLFEQVAEAGEARVERVETKPTTKWYVVLIIAFSQIGARSVTIWHLSKRIQLERRRLGDERLD